MFCFQKNIPNPCSPLFHPYRIESNILNLCDIVEIDLTMLGVGSMQVCKKRFDGDLFKKIGFFSIDNFVFFLFFFSFLISIWFLGYLLMCRRGVVVVLIFNLPEVDVVSPPTFSFFFQ